MENKENKRGFNQADFVPITLLLYPFSPLVAIGYCPETLECKTFRNAFPNIDLYTYQVAHLHDSISGQKDIK